MDDDTHIKFIGELTSGKSKFNIYYHSHRSRYGTLHQVDRVLIFDDGCRYIGHYMTMSEPLHINGESIIFEKTDYPENIIHFTNGQPPPHALIDGEFNDFTRR